MDATDLQHWLGRQQRRHERWVSVLPVGDNVIASYPIAMAYPHLEFSMVTIVAWSPRRETRHRTIVRACETLARRTEGRDDMPPFTLVNRIANAMRLRMAADGVWVFGTSTSLGEDGEVVGWSGIPYQLAQMEGLPGAEPHTRTGA